MDEMSGEAIPMQPTNNNTKGSCMAKLRRAEIDMQSIPMNMIEILMMLMMMMMINSWQGCDLMMAKSQRTIQDIKEKQPQQVKGKSTFRWQGK